MKIKSETKYLFGKWVCIIAGILLIMDTIYVRTVSNWNLGVILPALLGIPLLLYGIFKRKLDIWFQRGFGKFIKWLFICGYLFLIVIFTVFTGMITHVAHTPPTPGTDAIIVLGAGIDGEEPTSSLRSRLDTAAEYYTFNPDAIIIVTGGTGVKEVYSEAHVMKTYLVENGVPADAVIEENKATSTYDNFYFSKEILDNLFGSCYRTVYVTNDFHIMRAGIIAQDAGLNAQGLAARTPANIVPNNYMRESLALLASYVFGPDTASSIQSLLYK